MEQNIKIYQTDCRKLEIAARIKFVGLFNFITIQNEIIKLICFQYQQLVSLTLKLFYVLLRKDDVFSRMNASMQEVEV